TQGLELEFGKEDIVIDLLKKIVNREGIGDLLAEGSRIAAQKLGKNSSHFAMNVKGMELPAYDPRAAKICGLAYVTANRGGDHITAFIEGPTFIDSPFLLVDDSKIEDPFVANPKETKVVVDLENALTAFDAIGACKFMGLLLPASDYVELINSALGWDMDVDEFRQCGERIYNLVRMYNARAGMDRSHDVLPKRLMEDPLPQGPAKGMVIDSETLEMMKDAYYEFRDWEKSTGNPSKEKLAELDLEGI
ncbi:MAG: aldehyde ferredoxin oxidoreductase, partial [Desulfobacterales bacterium]|nr:aldehyde ferredoxin oxidoreductase [Desulfobacterales bacterium]